jgi:hypothetical protein
MLSITIQPDQYETSSDFALSDFDLQSLIATMKQSISWKKGELNSMVLLKNPDEQIILAAMPDGIEIESFQSNESVTFKILEGKLMLHILKDSISINADQLITLKQHIGYRLTANEKTIFLMTITGSNNITVCN